MVSTIPIGKYRKLSFSALRGRFLKIYNTIYLQFVWCLVGVISKYQNAPNFVKFLECYRWRLVQWFRSKIKKNNSEKSIILCVRFQRRTLFNFLLCFSYIIKYSHKASFYQNIVKAQWQCSPIAKRKNRLNNKIPFKNVNVFIFKLYVVFNLINGIRTV